MKLEGMSYAELLKYARSLEIDVDRLKTKLAAANKWIEYWHPFVSVGENK